MLLKLGNYISSGHAGLMARSSPLPGVFSSSLVNSNQENTLLNDNRLLKFNDELDDDLNID